MKNKQTIEVHFTHPSNSTTLTADISPQCTGQEAYEELLADSGEGAFIAPPPLGNVYYLVVSRNHREITQNMTFEQAGVIDGDIIDIRLPGQGGGPTWLELGYMLFWSVAAASMFLKSAAPILIEFLKSRGSRSILVQRGELKIVITGDDPEKVKEILKLLGASQTNDTVLEGADESNNNLDLPIKVTLLDSEKANSTEQ